MENENTSAQTLDKIFNESGGAQEAAKEDISKEPDTNVINQENLRTRHNTPRQFAPKPVQPTENLSDKYLGENALNTYYYLNVSEGKVVLSDLGIPIRPGMPVDLLDVANEEDILKSKDLRRSVKAHGNRQPLLKRLTEDEFNRLYSRFSEREAKIEAVRREKEKQLDDAQKNPKGFKINKGSDSDSNLDIRASLQSLVEKLRIGTLNVNDREAQEIARNKVAGITAEEFLAKIEVMQLKPDEVEYIYQTVMNKEIRRELQNKYGFKGA